MSEITSLVFKMTQRINLSMKRCCRKMREDLPLLPLLRWTEDESDVLALALHQPTCSNPSVVGGKAASLALLTGASFSTLKHKVSVITLTGG